MTNQINDGGPAFPLPAHGDEHQCRYYMTQQGMTLRDYFAAAVFPSVDQRSHGSPDQIACECYQLADAMLKAREAKP